MRVKRLVVTIVAAFAISMGYGGVAIGAESRAPATVRVGVDMTNLAFDGYMVGGPACGIGTDYESLASVSPHGRRFVVVVRKGDLKRRVNQYSILLWKIGQSGPEGPSRILRMSSSTYNPAIDPGTLVWGRNGRSITFLGARGSSPVQIYRYEIASKKLEVLTDSRTSIVSFSIDETGDAWAYGAAGASRSLWNRETMAHGLPITSQSLLSVTFGRVQGGKAPLSTLVVFDRHGTRQIPPLPGSRFSYGRGGLDARTVSMSPNGRYVIVPETVPNRGVPKLWRKYTDPLVRIQMSALGVALRHNSERFFPFSRLVVVDLRTGRSRILLDAPVPAGMSRPIVWAPNSRSVIISRILLPIDTGASDVRQVESRRQTVEVNIRSGRVTPVGAQCKEALTWNRAGLECKSKIFSYDTELRHALSRTGAWPSAMSTVCPVPEEIRFQRSKDGRWHATSGEEAPPLDVVLREGRNSPPELYYRNRNEGHARLLLNLNPQFRHIALARERLVTWDWSKGEPITAGLYYPPNYRSGKRYPLVIQTHGVDPSLFAYWGDSPVSNAAQPLAAHDVFVLQVNDTEMIQNGKGGQLEEARRAVKIYQTAIAYLAGRGLIDPDRVGIIGFSHTCFLVDWALTHDPRLFAAASVTEGGDGSPMEYMLGLENSVNEQSLYGGPPFGATLKDWVRRAPIFHVNRVRTPLLLVVPHHEGAIYEWEWLRGLRMLKKPVQMLVLDGRIKDLHVMQVPMSIAVASGESVDWFDFWLNGREARGPATRSEYRHWQRLCAEQKRENPGRPVYCVTRRPRDRAVHRGAAAASVRPNLLQPRLAGQVVHDARGRDREKGLIRRQVAF